MPANVISDIDFDQIINNTYKPVLVDFWAEWCQPCKNFAPVLHAFADSQEDIEVYKANLESTMTNAAKYAVRSVPTLILFREGKLIAAYHGTMNEAALKDWCERMLQ